MRIDRWSYSPTSGRRGAGVFTKSAPRFSERSDYNNSLFHGIGRHDLDALDHDPFRRLTRLACAISSDWNLADFFQDVRAFDQLAERGVLPIEPPDGREADEELRTGRIRIGPTRHRDHAALVCVIVVFGFDFVTLVALSIAVL